MSEKADAAFHRLLTNMRDTRTNGGLPDCFVVPRRTMEYQSTLPLFIVSGSVVIEEEFDGELGVDG